MTGATILVKDLSFLDEVCPSVNQLRILLETLPPKGNMKTDKQTDIRSSVTSQVQN